MRQAAFASPSESRQHRKSAARYEWQDTAVLPLESFASLRQHAFGFARPIESRSVPDQYPGCNMDCFRLPDKHSHPAARRLVPDKSKRPAA